MPNEFVQRCDEHTAAHYAPKESLWFIPLQIAPTLYHDTAQA